MKGIKYKVCYHKKKIKCKHFFLFQSQLTSSFNNILKTISEYRRVTENAIKNRRVKYEDETSS